MSTFARITVTLPGELLRDIDRQERNRSKFVAEAVRHELELRRREELRRSLESPHAETAKLAEQGYEDWWNGLPEEDTGGLLDAGAGVEVRWVPEEGWKEGPGEA